MIDARRGNQQWQRLQQLVECALQSLRLDVAHAVQLGGSRLQPRQARAQIDQSPLIRRLLGLLECDGGLESLDGRSNFALELGSRPDQRCAQLRLAVSHLLAQTDALVGRECGGVQRGVVLHAQLAVALSAPECGRGCAVRSARATRRGLHLNLHPLLLQCSLQLLAALE